MTAHPVTVLKLLEAAVRRGDRPATAVALLQAREALSAFCRHTGCPEPALRVVHGPAGLCEKHRRQMWERSLSRRKATLAVPQTPVYKIPDGWKNGGAA